MPDIAEVGVRNTYQLLFVTKQATKDILTNVSSIHIVALNQRSSGTSFKSGEDFLKLVSAIAAKRALTSSVVASPEQFTTAGKAFWKLAMEPAVNGVIIHVVEIAGIERAYALLFVFTSPDASKLDELVHTMQSLHFTDATP